jgi:drug/metabolite transporter (DMT)-like permease
MQTGRATFADRRIIGLVQIVTAAVGYGLLGIFGKRAYRTGMQPGELLALHFLLASAVLWSYILVAKRSALRITFRQAVNCAVLGVLGYALFSTLYFEALKGLSVSLTVLLLYTYPAIVMIGSWLLFKERVTRTQRHLTFARKMRRWDICWNWCENGMCQATVEADTRHQ